jgi:hypothetical protein
MTKLVDISTFDAVAESEQPFDLTMKNADGSDTPVVLCILGQYSSLVEKWNSEFIRKYQREIEMAKRKGKDPEMRSYEEMRDQDIEGTLVRIAGWKNVAGEYDKEKMRNALLRNPHWRKQIQDASEDASNFTKTA